ncbi:MAG: ATP-dependent zinc metalloprotease FtsH [Peptoniphilus harei]|uniref:ATP-dependent zinc metalloprotease FtsH n=1 Tax=Peptoniphilus harei TaxID=54005 RepID=UPI00254FC8A6|nr:ATP-dependent zinc metalloprotease FtsH [Peptoniphilus harei]MDK7754672.1 ATP-dependent zinc metalloprotease FtsH [Peptoniphilus harei]MDK7760478.1 ATP-dependent zinc metalloprotease FtsH [Peptoniphilus harei]MDK8270268.1 ATP-dependent zinc metalloprotease FtsH [Peptoniphilus harei]MDK8338728.1 ATP-dependent zinc metalloprotease FtsH [Peptoniphilus harei]MDU7531672.1 ATP-dependent zinc metalloprotease FtsH [Peptoniphilus harei]
MEDKDNNKRPRYNLLRYYLISILAVFALNWLILPMVTQNSIEGSSYSDFRNNLSQNKIEEVSFKQDQILYKLKDDKKIYKTGKMEDPDIVKDLEEKNVDYSSEIPEKPSLFMNFVMTWGFPILLFFLLQRAMTKRMQNLGSGGIFGGGKKIEKYEPSGETVNFDDVAGQEEAEESLVEIVDYLKNPKKYTDIGAKCPKGALLVGPPGTGKTLLARAVAGESHVPFFSIAGSEFVEMFVGRGAAKVRELFDEAKKNAPCIIFIDEIDTIGKKRDSAGISGNDEREQTLNQLLTEMDGFDGNIGIVMLAATNRPEILDPALLRPGRFDRQIRVELPTLKDRIEILKVHARSYKMEDDIDYSLIARSTAGASGAQLANILNEAALRAVRMGHDKVRQEDIQESIEVVIAGAQRKQDILSPEEKKRVAYHEIGHALVAALQTGSEPVEKITIIPRTSGALGYTMQVPKDEKNLYTREDLINHITTLCGGRAAEEVIFNEVSTGAANDIEKATETARSMITQYGMADEFGMVKFQDSGSRYMGDNGNMNCSEETRKEIDDLMVKIVKSAQDKARQLIADNRDAMKELSEFLLEEETITGKQFMEILSKYKNFDEEE